MVELSSADAALLLRMAKGLMAVDGVRAVALGGSFAAGTARPDSDLDVGIYYRGEDLDIDGLRRWASELDPVGAASLTARGIWGPWMDGGAWLGIGGRRVDWIYRDLERLSREIDAAERGEVSWHYTQQPPHGFVSVILLAELDVCVPLADPQGSLAELKARVATYPPALRERISVDFLWLAQFTLAQAHKYAARADVVNTVGCLARIEALLVQVVHAIEGRYFLNDKQALAPLAEADRVLLEEVLSAPGRSAAELARSVERMGQLFERVRSRVPGYAPHAELP